MQVFEDIRAEEQGGANVAGVKEALRLMGHDFGAARPPAAWPLTDAGRARLWAFMEANGLFRSAAGAVLDHHAFLRMRTSPE